MSVLTGRFAGCGTEVKVGDEVHCYYRESDGFISQQLTGIVGPEDGGGRFPVDGNDLALTCAPSVDILTPLNSTKLT